MQVHTQGVLPSTPRPFLTDLGSQELSSRAKGTEEMCGGGSAFPCECGATPYGPSSGITAPKKGTPRNAFPGGWDREFAGCGESDPPSGRKRQPPGVCLQASIWKEQVRIYNGRPPDLLRRPKFQKHGRVSSLPFAILAKTSPADSGTAHQEASSDGREDRDGEYM